MPDCLSLSRMDQPNGVSDHGLLCLDKQINHLFDVVTQATVNQLSVFTQGAFQAGRELQLEVIDRLFRPDTLVKPACGNVFALLGNMMGWSVESGWRLLPGSDSLLVLEELQNKIVVFILVLTAPSQLHLPSVPPFPDLSEALARVDAIDFYPALWAIEGLGHWYGDTFWKQKVRPTRALEQWTQALPPQSLLMMHAGLGLSIAQHFLTRVNHLSPRPDIRQAVQQTVSLCRENAIDGYAGAALESLGLVTRSGTFSKDAKPEVMARIVGEELAALDPEALGYFWHGVGRAIYFLPIHFLPFYSSVKQAIDMVQREVPDEYARLNAVSGLAWGITMVNIRNPAILANILNKYEKVLTADDAFSNGVVSSIMMRFDTTPSASFIKSFYQYKPDSSDTNLFYLWNEQIYIPCNNSIEYYYPVIKRENRLEELFFYQSISNIMS